MLEVGVVDVRIDSEQSLEDHFNNSCEVLGEWNAELAREDFFVVQLILHPGH